MKDTKGVRQVLEEMFIKAGVKLTEIGWEVAGEVLDEVETELQEIMLGMLPEKQYTTVGLAVDPHDLSKGPEGKIPIQNEFNRAIKLIEQNIRGGFKGE